MSQAQQAQATSAFNLIIEGVGYLNRVREVPIRKGQPYLACTVNALMGVEGSVEYVSIDCKIVGRQAIDAIKLLRQSVDNRAKVIVGFRASDPRPDFYEYERNGEKVQVEGFKARLLQLTFAKVNGQVFEIPLVERPNAQPQDLAGDHDGAPDGLADHDDIDGAHTDVDTRVAAPRPTDRTAVRGFQPTARH